MKKLSYLIVLTLILGLVLTGCLLSNVGQVPTSEQSGISYLTKGGTLDAEVFTLYAGQDINVGTVSVWNGIDGVLGVECLFVKYEITMAGWRLIETHLAVVATTPDDIPQTKKHNPIPGQFPYKHEDLDFVTSDEHIIPLSEIDGATTEDDVIFIAAQASLQNLNNSDELVGTVIVNAVNPFATCSGVTLESGKKYQLKAGGTAFAGDTIDFDAKYSITNRIPGDLWTDSVSGYTGYGTTLLELSVDGDFVNWGVYDSTHVYYWDMTGKDSCVALLIDDIYYPGNSGSLTVDIYLYQEETAWAGIVVEGETRIPFLGKNWATYCEYTVQAVDVLDLYQKNPITWEKVPDGAEGRLIYNSSGPTFDFVFNGHDLVLGWDYTLIYYPDPWPGTGLLCLGSGTADGLGDLNFMGSVEINTDLPIAGDTNPGAKIWLVLSDDVDCIAGSWALPWVWNPSEYLFEHDLINFDDIDIP